MAFSPKQINRVIFVLSIIGTIMAIYVLQSFIRQTPIVCVNSGCELVRKNSASFIIGIPVPAFGLIGYSLLAVLSFSLTFSDNLWKKRLMLGISIFGIFFVTWFTYTEIFVIKAICTWCAVSAVNMFIIFSLLLKITRNKNLYCS